MSYFVAFLGSLFLAVSGNFIPDLSFPELISSVSGNESVSNNEIIDNDIVEDGVKNEIKDSNEGDSAADQLHVSPPVVEIPSIQDIEKIIVENKEAQEIIVTVSDNFLSVSDNSISANDILPINESLTIMSTALTFMAANIEPTLSSVQISEYYVNYFRGILQNMPYTNYLAYAERLRVNNTNQYITHYYLFYDLEFDNDGNIIRRTYPCIDIWSENSVYYFEETYKLFQGYPTFGYASFAPYSSLVDRSFHFNDLYINPICALLFYGTGST